jgi:hypothetical protein
MLRLPDRESSPEEIDDDDGLEHLFWIPSGVESLSNSLRLSSPALKPPPQASAPRLRALVLCLRPRAWVFCLRPRAASPTPAPEPPFPVPVPTPGTNKRLRKRKYIAIDV